MPSAHVKILGTGLIYRNPKPHVHSVHAYFPSVAVFGNGEMVATFALGAAFEAPNLHAYVARSRDQGETWAQEGPVYPGTRRRLTSDTVRLTALPRREAVLFMVRADRTEHPDEGLANPENLGFVPTELLLLRSGDRGRTWSPPRVLRPPLVGPAFEICCPITPLRDGRWVLPTSTWHAWNGDCPNGVKMIALVSADRGRTWPAYWDVMADPAQKTIYWESKIVELPDGRLLAAAWAYDRIAACDLPNQYALSEDGGATWSRPQSTGLRGQTLTPFVLADGRVVCAYRRMDAPGLWATLVRLDGRRWVNEGYTPLWGTGATGLTGRSRNMVRNFNVLRFGAPCVTQLAEGTLFVAFWCYEECVSVIRWFKLRVA